MDEFRRKVALEVLEI